MKGLPIAAIPQGHNLQIWFSSPTGDSSDSIIFNIPCHNNDQARGLAAEYGKFMKGIYPVYEISETTHKVISDLQQEVRELRHWDEANLDNIKRLQEQLENANQKVQALTTTLIKHYDKSWFDQTVSF